MKKPKPYNKTMYKSGQNLLTVLPIMLSLSLRKDNTPFGLLTT